MGVFGTKKQIKQYLSLSITDERVTGAVWHIDQSQVRVDEMAPSVPWSADTDTSLAEAVDVAIEKLGKQAEKLDEIVLGLPETWVKDQRILPARRVLLQEMRRQLQLKALGFVVIQEAIAQYLAMLEQREISAVVFEVREQELIFFQINAGVAEQSDSVQLSDDISHDLEEIVARIGPETIPSRILLMSEHLTEEELQSFAADLAGLDWSGFGVSGFPSIEMLDSAFVISSVTVVAGLEVSKQDEVVSVAAPPTSQAGEFGFTEVSSDGAESAARRTAIPIDQLEAVEPSMQVSGTPISRFFTSLFGGRSVNQKDKGYRTGNTQKRLVLGGIVAVLISAVIGSMLYVYFSYQVVVEVTLKPFELTRDLEMALVIADQDPPEDVTIPVVAAELITIEQSETQEIETTGTAIVGDVATGKVKIFNATQSPKTFPAETVIQSGNLKFTLDNEVTIASASGSSLLDLKPGEGEVEVTAQEIGPESNLSENTEFSVANFDKNTYVARSVAAFSGGTSRTIQAVSAQDRQQLRALVIQTLFDKASEGLTTNASETVFVVPYGEPEIIKELYSGAVNDEDKVLSLQMTVKFQFLEYTREDLLLAATTAFSQELGQGTSLLAEKTIVQPGELMISTNSGELRLDSQVTISYVQLVEPQEIQKALAGKSAPQARSYLSESQEFSSFLIGFEPAIVGPLFDAIPQDPERVRVQVRMP